MNEELVRCLVEMYVNAREMLATGLRVVEELPERSRIGDDLRTACTEAVLFSRSCGTGATSELPWKVDQVVARFTTAEVLLRRLRAEERSIRAYVGAGIEIAERGRGAARAGAEILATRSPKPRHD